jgi:hypothetical protein
VIDVPAAGGDTTPAARTRPERVVDRAVHFRWPGMVVRVSMSEASDIAV